MRLNSSDASRVLTALIQEDRAEARIWRDRIQKAASSLVVASFLTSAFLIGRGTNLTVQQFRTITLLVDLGLVAVVAVFFWRLKVDLVRLREGAKARQDLLLNLKDGETQEIDPFRPGNGVSIRDHDLYWIVILSVTMVLVKMAVLLALATEFVGHR